MAMSPSARAAKQLDISPPVCSLTLSHTQLLQMSETYTLADVSRHNTPESAWIVVDGNVYDITTDSHKIEGR